jgi:hypothetical protein
MGWQIKKVLEIQKRVLLSSKGLNKRESCRQIFKELNILTVTTLYIFDVLCYKKKLFKQ